MEKITLNITGVGSSDRVFAAVSKVTGMSHSKIISSSRLWQIVEARTISIISFNRLGLVDEKIALLINRARPTVCKSRKVGERLLKDSKTFKEKFHKVQTLLTNQQHG